jgi:hypothetical protein
VSTAAGGGEDGTIRRVAWGEVFPWISLARCLGMSLRVHALAMSLAAMVLTILGWWLLSLAFHRAEELPGAGAWNAVVGMVPDRPEVPAELKSLLRLSPPATPVVESLEKDGADPLLTHSPEPFWGTWEHLSRPFRELFAPNASWSDKAFFASAALWALAVWSAFGGAITRWAAVELATGERLGWKAVYRHVRTKWLSYAWAPLMPLVVVLLAALGSGIFGLLLRFGPTALLASLAWPVLLVVWGVLVLLLTALFFGWPLMWAAISVEGTDSFDGLSRANNYTFHRPLHYAFYAMVAAFLGLLGWWLVSNLAGATIYLSEWSTGIGTLNLNPGPFTRTAIALIAFFERCVKLLAVAYLYSYFWTAVTAIYFLLRRDVAHREMDEVFLEEDQGEQTYGLPPLKTDAAGAPVVVDQTS